MFYVILGQHNIRDCRKYWQVHWYNQTRSSCSRTQTYLFSWSWTGWSYLIEKRPVARVMSGCFSLFKLSTSVKKNVTAMLQANL